MENATRISVLMFLMFGLSACDSIGGSGEPDEATLDPDAYEYKGAADPLLSVSGEDRAAGLADRFKLIQGRQ